MNELELMNEVIHQLGLKTEEEQIEEIQEEYWMRVHGEPLEAKE